MKIYCLLGMLLISETTVAMQQNQKTASVYLAQQKQQNNTTDQLLPDLMPEYRDLEQQLTHHKQNELERLRSEAAHELSPRTKKFCGYCAYFGVTCVALLMISAGAINISWLLVSEYYNTRNGTSS